MNDTYISQNGSDRSDLFEILALFRSDLSPRKSDRSDRPSTAESTGPTDPTADHLCRTGKNSQNQRGPTGPTDIYPNTSAENPPNSDAVDLLETYEERAAIREYDAGQPHVEAEAGALVEVAGATGVTPETLRRLWAAHPDAVAYLAHLFSKGPATCVTVALALQWDTRRAWLAEARLRAVGLVKLDSNGRAEPYMEERSTCQTP